MVGLVSLGACAPVGQWQYAPPFCPNHLQIAFLQQPDTCVAGRLSLPKIAKDGFDSWRCVIIGQ